MKNLSNNRGYTLVEVLVVTVISTILFGVLVSIIISGNKQYYLIKKEEEIFSELQLLRKAITNELKANNDIKLEKNDEDLDTSNTYHILKTNDKNTISYDKYEKKLSLNSSELAFKHIEDIYFQRYNTSNLLVIYIKYNQESISKIYFSCVELEDV